MTTILDKILETKRAEIEAAKRESNVAELEQAAAAAPPVRDFAQALLSSKHPVALIAEVKKASPSAGLIRADFDPRQIAGEYQAAGAACISVLTDEVFFQGRLEYLQVVRRAVQIPVLRKDFIIDPFQILQARAAGADCVLLIAECLSPEQLAELHQAAIQWGMQTLIELYDAENLEMVLATGGRIVGINNRDLRTFETNLAHTVRMRQQIPDDRIVVGESGIRTPHDVRQLAEAGVHAMLVGESLMRHADIRSAVARLLAPAG